MNIKKLASFLTSADSQNLETGHLKYMLTVLIQGIYVNCVNSRIRYVHNIVVIVFIYQNEKEIDI